MSISDKARLISSILSSLTLSDLQSLKQELDSIISTKNVDNIKEDINERMYNTIEFLNPITDVNVLTLHPLNSLKDKKTIPQPLCGNESTVFSSPIVFSFNIGGEIKEITSTQKSPRPLGIWKGQVEISEDFYKTSSDILSEFGIEG
ncbi:hypothetical protein LC613_07780 [Nostoc sphaeroides CHAB 2801]|uniref:hypothetical protein n=1 Tax=Nostoc sphaeroides TaxID=446679 RepID=UPI000E54FB37|nr:hypothetical protein [Nostoc sphaeroides]MCC5628033.1 hypothetical protein [Nostoc sphaeroides CHAB 2801]